MTNEAVDAARALLPGAGWAPYAFGAASLVGGAVAARCGERRLWLVAAVWGAALLACWGPFSPVARVPWAIGGAALAAAGAAVPVGAGPRWLGWLPLGVWLAAAAGLRQAPALALTAGVGGTDALVALALERAEAGEVDEGIVHAEAALALEPEEPQAALVAASLYASEGDCDTAVRRARVAHLALGSELPRLDEAIRACFAARGP